ncbi:MAG TPA: site-2 protease family protein [Gaiellaceae bacterium]|nr:site-2 protease family protein [Gaiellaceae bacterium]
MSEDPGGWQDPPQYDPINSGPNWRARLRKLFGPVIAAVVVLAKWLFLLAKFSTIFIAVAAYALIFGWKFAIGFVTLILLHETGHYIEARREGLQPRLPIFVPFLGAYVRYTRGLPWQTVRVAIAGPILGGAAAAVCYVIGESHHSKLFLALGYVGFLLNLINLLPFWPLDGGAIWQSARWLRLGGGRRRAYYAYLFYAATALMLLLGMIATYRHQTRL